MRIERLGTIYVIADCETCGWHCGDFMAAKRKGCDHAKKLGHRVVVETGNATIYRGGEQ